MYNLLHLNWLHCGIEAAVEGLVHVHWVLHRALVQKWLEGPPPPTGDAQSTHKRELVLSTDWLTQNRHTAWGDWMWFAHQLDRAQWRDGETHPFQLWTSSSHLVWVVLVYHQLHFVHVSKAPIGTLQYPCFLQLLSQQPLQIFAKGFVVLHPAGANSEQWTVQNDLCYGTICVYTTWQICNYNVCQMPLYEDRQITHVATATCGKGIQWQDNKYTHTHHTWNTPVVRKY